MKKVFLLLLIFPLLQLACDNNGQDCPKVDSFFNITGLTLLPQTMEFKNGGYGIRPLHDLDSAKLEEFYLEGTFQAEYYGVNSKPFFSIFPQAYARDVEPCPSAGYKGSEEKLAGFHLISLGKFNTTIQPGDTLKNGFLVNSLQLPNYLAQNQEKIDFQQFVITFTEKPDPQEFQSFKLIYKLTNGETYEEITPRFKFY